MILFLWCYRYTAVSPLLQGAASLLPDMILRGAVPMVTFTDLIQIGILIVGIIGLFIQAKKK